MDSFYQEPMATIYCGDALEVLKALPAESVQMAMTSPPYWGLRNYAGGSDFIWGGNKNCQHEWSQENILRKGHPGDKSTLVGTQTATIAKEAVNQGSFCSLCGAWRGQLGLEPTPELYVEHLMMVLREVKRVLRKDGSFYLNIGDTYGGSGSPGGDFKDNKGDKYLRPYAQRNLQPKCMVCIPERVMLAMIEDGWVLRNKNIWHKSNSMPSSVKDRYSTTWEYLYFFAKNNQTILWRNRETSEWKDTRPSKDENYPYGMRDEEGNKRQPLWMGFSYYFELDAVRKPHKSNRPSGNIERKIPYTHKGNLGHSIPWQPFNLRIRDVKRGKGGTFVQGGEVKELQASEQEVEGYEYPEKIQKHESADLRLGAQAPARKRHSGYFGEDGQPLVDFVKGKNPGDLWSLTTKPSSISVCPQCDTVFPRLMKICPNCKTEGVVGHFAPYPEALCEDPIKVSSKEGDTVLDMFAGGGSTGVAAKRLGRKAILIDCVRPYCIMARYKLKRVEYQPELEHSYQNI